MATPESVIEIGSTGVRLLVAVQNHVHAVEDELAPLVVGMKRRGKSGERGMLTLHEQPQRAWGNDFPLPRRTIEHLSVPEVGREESRGRSLARLDCEPMQHWIELAPFRRIWS